jgi:hypothetical protein
MVATRRFTKETLAWQDQISGRLYGVALLTQEGYHPRILDFLRRRLAFIGQYI